MTMSEMRSRSSHGFLVALALVLGTLATIGGAGARWIDRQTLDTATWVHTASRLIADPQVRRGVADYAVREALTANGIDSELHRLLPAAVADRVQATVHRTATQLAGGVLVSGPARRAWRIANRQAQTELLSVLEDPRPGHETVTLALGPLLHDLLQALAGSTVAHAIPGAGRLLSAQSPTAGRLVVLRPDRVRTLRGDVSTVRTLAWALPALALAAFLVALAIASGRRGATLSRIGYCLILAGALVLIARPLLRSPIADALVSGSIDRTAVGAGWMIATSQLRNLGEAVVVGGGVVAVVSWALRALSARRGAFAGTARPSGRGRARW